MTQILAICQWTEKNSLVVLHRAVLHVNQRPVARSLQQGKSIVTNLLQKANQTLPHLPKRTSLPSNNLNATPTSISSNHVHNSKRQLRAQHQPPPKTHQPVQFIQPLLTILSLHHLSWNITHPELSVSYSLLTNPAGILAFIIPTTLISATSATKDLLVFMNQRATSHPLKPITSI